MRPEHAITWIPNMDIEVLKSYLVDLGFKVNNPELRKFDTALKDAATSVESRTTGIVKNLLKWQGATTGALVGVSGAVLGMVDNVAKADQQYRLLGERMFMSKDSAKRLQVVLDALGVTLEDVWRDPELKVRFLEMSKKFDEASAKIGAGFSDNMRHVRDFQASIATARVELGLFRDAIADKIAAKLGPQLDYLIAKFKEWGDYIIAHIPEWSDVFAEKFLPVLAETGTALNAVWNAVKIVAGAVDNLSRALSGEGIDNAPTTFDSVAKSIERVLHIVAIVAHTIGLLTTGIAEFGRTAADVVAGVVQSVVGLSKEIQALWALLHGDKAGAAKLAGEGFAKAKGYFVDAGKSAGKGVEDVGFSMFGGALNKHAKGLTAWVAGHNADVKPFLDFENKKPLPSKSGTSTTPAGSTPASKTNPDGFGFSFPAAATIADQVTAAAKKYGINPDLLHALAHQESGEKQFNADGSLVSSGKAFGVMQLQAKTAKWLGLDYKDASQNINGGAKFFAQLLKKYNDIPKALAAYNWGPGNLDRMIKQHSSFMPAETRNYVDRIMGRAGMGGQTVTIGDVHIAIGGTNASGQEIRTSVAQGVSDAMEKQRNLAQLRFVPAGAY